MSHCGVPGAARDFTQPGAIENSLNPPGSQRTRQNASDCSASHPTADERLAPGHAEPNQREPSVASASSVKSKVNETADERRPKSARVRASASRARVVIPNRPDGLGHSFVRMMIVSSVRFLQQPLKASVGDLEVTMQLHEAPMSDARCRKNARELRRSASR